MKKGLVLLLITFFFTACGAQNNPPENLINEDTYINIMIELQLLRSYQKQSNVDSTTIDSLMQAIFNKYDVTKKQFKQSHEYYKNQIEKQAERIEIVIDRLRKDKIQKDTTSTTGNTNNR